MRSLIHDTYARAYGADLKRFAPHLVGLHGDDGMLLGAMGLRDAAAGPLFLECYLDVPVEEAIAARLGRPVSRARVAEVSHLALAVPGAGRLLLAAMTATMFRCGYDWITFTVVRALRNTFRRAGFALVPIAPASADRAPRDGTEWGRYYQHDPMVMAGAISPAYRLLRSGALPLPLPAGRREAA